MREKLRASFMQSIQKMGGDLEKIGEYQEAINLYQRGTEVDDLSEELYQKLMVIHGTRGSAAEALRWYKKCRTTLKNVLDIPPSPETEKIHTAIRNNDSQYLANLAKLSM